MRQTADAIKTCNNTNAMAFFVPKLDILKTLTEGILGIQQKNRLTRNLVKSNHGTPQICDQTINNIGFSVDVKLLW